MNKYIKEKYLIKLINEYKKYSVSEILKIIHNYCIDKFSDSFTINTSICAFTKTKLLSFEYLKIYSEPEENELTKQIIKINMDEKKQLINNFLRCSRLTHTDIIEQLDNYEIGNIETTCIGITNIDPIINMLNEYEICEYYINVHIDLVHPSVVFDKSELQNIVPVEFKNKIKIDSRITTDSQKNYVNICTHN
jgi:hypothetical protein